MNPFQKKHKQKSIFVTAGYPNLESLMDQIPLLEKNGIDFIEVGIPFSDPLADGPIIQKTSEIALDNGMNLPLLFEQLQKIETRIPLVLMGYLNPILNYGIEAFVRKCVELNIASVILPDLSIEIYERFYQKIFEENNLPISFLITPETSDDRIKKAAHHSQQSFVYLVSSNATTGGKIQLQDQLQKFKRIKSVCQNTPVMVGFGIRSKEDVLNVQSVVDGVIIGSAYLNALSMNEEKTFLASI